MRNNAVRISHEASCIQTKVEMRDGVMLATDIYLPPTDDIEDRWPVVIERTPYDRQGESRWELNPALGDKPMTRIEVADYISRRGYAVVMQDCRGRYESEGKFIKYLNEAEDGYDTLEWLLKQPWCNGKIGTMGMSYGAHTQTSLASLNPPGLACMFLDSGGFWSAYHEGIRQGGAFELKQAVWAHRHAIKNAEYAGDLETAAKLRSQELAEWFARMPWAPGDSPLCASPEYETYLFEQWTKGHFSDYWRSPGLCADAYYGSFPDIPIFILGSWYDAYVRTSIMHYLNLSKQKSSPIHLAMGPWTHGARSSTHSGETDFGESSTFESIFGQSYLDFRIRWFDQWLKGTSDSRNIEDRVTLFVMGGGSGRPNNRGRVDHGGKWRRFSSYPPRDGQKKRLYLDSLGCLSPQKNDVVEAWLQYEYDPRDPTPTVGGAITSGEPYMFGGAFDQRENESLLGCTNPGRPISDRRDVLTFETAPLSQDLYIVGEARVSLFISSDCVDTDFHIKLIDVYPQDGINANCAALNLAHGVIRMRYRDSWEYPELMEPGEVYRVEVPLTPTANLFKKGHKVRLDISSCSFPQFDLNPNTGEPEGMWRKAQVAKNRVYVSGDNNSCIDLPILS